MLRRLAERIDGTETLIDPARVDDVDQARIGLLMADFPKLSFGNVGSKKGDVAELRALVAHVVEIRDAQLARLRLQALVPLVDRVARFTLDGAGERRLTGRLEFHDLLVRAVRLIETDLSVRLTLGDRWRVLLVDEFQDTDPLQLRLATLLALAEPEVVPPTWSESVCAPGRLFFVGDPKQSIYRFRRADIALYDQAKDTFADGSVQLTRNFRTVPEVIDWINEAFSALFGEGVREAAAGLPRPRAGATVARRSASRRWWCSVDRWPVPASVRSATPRRLSSPPTSVTSWPTAWSCAIRVGVASGRLATTTSPCCCPTRATLAQLERELDGAGVPYRIESRSLVFGTDEVRELLGDPPGDRPSRRPGGAGGRAAIGGLRLLRSRPRRVPVGGREMVAVGAHAC